MTALYTRNIILRKIEIKIFSDFAMKGYISYISISPKKLFSYGTGNCNLKIFYVMILIYLIKYSYI